MRKVGKEGSGEECVRRVDELDYYKEAESGFEFQESLKVLGFVRTPKSGQGVFQREGAGHGVR